MNGRWISAAAVLAAITAMAGTAFAQASSVAPVQIRTPERFAQTPPLRDVPMQMPTVLQRLVGSHKISRWQMESLRERLIREGYLSPDGKRSIPVHRKGFVWAAPHARDPVRQTRMLDLHANGFTNLIANFDTISNQWSIFPPDPNAAVGDNYVVMIVNLGFAVYDKSGNLVMGPVNTNTLWQSLGGECASDNDGDPIVLYDQIGHRWLITQFAFSGPADQCIAISQTDDPTGSWYEYAYKIMANGLNDYPKFGVWPDAFYATWNMFPSDFSGVAFGAFDRVAMENGDPGAQMVLFPVDQSKSVVYSDLPASMDGMTPPPAGAPGIFINYVSPNLWGLDYGLYLWQMHVDWSNPANSTLSGPTVIPVNPFDDLCGNCVPQPSGPLLESLSDRLMYRLAYRNLGDHQALVLMHNVAADSGSAPMGERWYELDAPAGSTDPNAWTVAQQSTFSPADGASRWMGSIAMDHDGNIAMGYSRADSGQFPSIAYTGRLASDPPDEMTEPETTIQRGLGSQTRSGGRWGDYSSMVTDPTDDCTFWYANEYMPATSEQGWRGHIAAFKFSDCTNAGSGTVEGTVSDATTGEGIPFAHVSFEPGGAIAPTNDAGGYSITLAPGEYTATAAAGGYQPQSARVTVTDGGTTEQNFALSGATSVQLKVKVIDRGHRYPLYAEVMATSGAATVADVWTNPRTGVVKLNLPVNVHYTITVRPYFDGYTPARSAGVLRQKMKKSFLLSPAPSCSAPGYEVSGGTCVAIRGGLVEGLVVKRGTRTPLNGVTVSDEDGNSTTTATVHGRAGIYTLFEPAGGHTLTASKSGYQNGVKDVAVGWGEIVIVLFGLNPD